MDTRYFKIIFHLTLIVIVAKNSYSQNSDCWNDQNTISTHWNSEDSDNEWNWTTEFADAWINPDGYTTPEYFQIRMPMWAGPVINNLNVEYFQSQIPANKDHHPEDGWELLFHEFGNEGSNNGVTFPIYALYNRFQGRIRFFILVRYGPEIGDIPSGASIDMFFMENQNYRRTAILSSLDKYMRPVKNFDEENIKISNVNHVNAEDFQWFYADFQTHYDPCTCHLNTLSKITFALNTNIVSSINADINGTITQVSSDALSGDPTAGTKAKSFMDKADVVYKTGLEDYKLWSGYKDETIKILNSADTLFTRKLKRELGSFPEQLINILSDPAAYEEEYAEIMAQIGIISPECEGFPDVPYWLYEECADEYFSTNSAESDIQSVQGLLGSIEKINKAFSILKNVASAVPYVAAGISVVDALVTGAQTSNSMPAKAGPVVSNVELKLTGTIETPSTVSTSTFFLPGSDPDVVEPASQPIYDNILGVVSILDVPQFETKTFNKEIEFVLDPTTPATNCPQSVIDWHLPNNPSPQGTIKQYRLASDLKYALNPASNLTIVGVDAAYILEYYGPTSNEGGAISINFGKWPVILEDEACPNCSEIGDPYYSPTAPAAKSTINALEKQGMELEWLDNQFFTAISDPAKSIRLRTKYVPLECFKNRAFMLWNNTGGLAPKVYVKLMFRLIPQGHENDTDYKPLTIVQTYDISDRLNTASNVGNGTYTYRYNYITTPIIPPIDFVGENDNWEVEIVSDHFLGIDDESILFPDPFNYSEKTFSNETITSNVFGHTVHIEDNVVIDPGITITAANDIFINNENDYQSVPGNDVLFKIESYLGTCASTITAVHMTDPEILAVCNSDSYVNAARSAQEETLEPPVDIERSLAVYPNPVDSRLAIEFRILPGEESTLELLDISGRLIRSGQNNPFINERNVVVWNVDELASGIYFVVLHAGSEKLTQRVMVNHFKN